MAARPKPGTTLRRVHRWVVGAAIALAVLATGLWMLGTGLTRMSPGWWRSTAQDTPETRALAEQIENDVVNKMFEVRPGASPDWTVGLRAADANAWLNTRLAQWLVNQDERFVWPESVHDLQVEFDQGRVHVGAELRHEKGTQVLALTLRPEIDDEGALWLAAESVHVGRLPLPATWVIGQPDGRLTEVLPETVFDNAQAQRLVDALAGRVALEPTPLFGLGDGRAVRLLGIRASRGTLQITCRTERTD